jgi:hypothetical protein
MQKTAAEIANYVLQKTAFFGPQGDFRDASPEDYRDAVLARQKKILPILAGVTALEGAGIGTLLAHALGRKKVPGALIGGGIGAGLGGGAALIDRMRAQVKASRVMESVRVG